MKDIVRNVVIHGFDWGKTVRISFTETAHIDMTSFADGTDIIIYCPTDDDLRKIQHGLGEVK